MGVNGACVGARGGLGLGGAGRCGGFGGAGALVRRVAMPSFLEEVTEHRQGELSGSRIELKVKMDFSGVARFDVYSRQLAWDGATTLRVSANARARSVELRLPDGKVVTQWITETEGEIRAE